VKKVKNISKDTFGTQHGQIHIPKQNIDKLQTRKMKGLKKTASEKKEQRKRKSDAVGKETNENSTVKKMRT
jgi:ribosome production factor 2